MRWIPRLSRGRATFDSVHDDAEYEGRYLLIEWLGLAIEITLGRTDRPLP